jgi:hypothetical protein
MVKVMLLKLAVLCREIALSVQRPMLALRMQELMDEEALQRWQQQTLAVWWMPQSPLSQAATLSRMPHLVSAASRFLVATRSPLQLFHTVVRRPQGSMRAAVPDLNSLSFPEPPATTIASRLQGRPLHSTASMQRWEGPHQGQEADKDPQV